MNYAYMVQWWLFAAIGGGRLVGAAAPRGPRRGPGPDAGTAPTRRTGVRRAMTLPHRGLRPDRRHALGRARRPRRLDRLAVPAPLRLRRVASPGCSAATRTVTGGSPRPAVASSPAARYRTTRSCSRPSGTPPTGTVRVIDFMPPRDQVPNLVRIVEGVAAGSRCRRVLRLRLDYGRIVPWVRRIDGLHAIAGPDAVWLRADVAHEGRRLRLAVADFACAPATAYSFVLTWHPSHLREPDRRARSTTSRRPRSSGASGSGGAATPGRTATRSSAR